MNRRNTLFSILLAFNTGYAQDFEPSAVSVCSFSIGSRKYDVVPSVNNELGKPELWQFRYQPLFIPEYNDDGSIRFGDDYVIGTGSNIKHRTYFTLLLDSKRAQELAFEALKLAYPREAKSLSLHSVAAFDPTRIVVEIPELGAISPSAILPEATLFSEVRKDPSFRVVVEDVSDELLTTIKSQLIHVSIAYTVDLKARTTSKNQVAIRYDQLKTAKLYVTLNGINQSAVSPERYIHRDDVRQLTEHILDEIQIDAIISEPDKFTDNIVEHILKAWAESEDTKDFDANKYASTYNGIDLSPDEITKTLDKMFEYDEREEHFIHKNDYDVSAKANVIKIVDAELKGKVNISKDDLIKTLRQHEVEAQFEGKKMVAKSVLVKRFNLSDFNKSSAFFQNYVYVKDAGLKRLKNTLDLGYRDGDLLANHRSDLPVGSIIAFAGVDSVKMFDQGWMVCSGKVLLTREYPALFSAIATAWGNGGDNDHFRLPDLRGMFLRGLDSRQRNPDDLENVLRVPRQQGGNAGATVGSYQASATARPNTDFTTGTESNGHRHGYDDAYFAEVNCGHSDKLGSGSTDGDNNFCWRGQGILTGGPDQTHTHTVVAGGDRETRPANVYVMYMIKYR